jgi:septation ring formation regulator EzrA
MTTDIEWLQSCKSEMERLTKQRDEAQLAFGILEESYRNLRKELSLIREERNKLKAAMESL